MSPDPGANFHTLWHSNHSNNSPMLSWLLSQESLRFYGVFCALASQSLLRLVCAAGASDGRLVLLGEASRQLCAAVQAEAVAVHLRPWSQLKFPFSVEQYLLRTGNNLENQHPCTICIIIETVKEAVCDQHFQAASECGTSLRSAHDTNTINLQRTENS